MNKKNIKKQKGFKDFTLFANQIFIDKYPLEMGGKDLVESCKRKMAYAICEHLLKKKIIKFTTKQGKGGQFITAKLYVLSKKGKGKK